MRRRRFDTGEHRLADFDPHDPFSRRAFWPGQDYSNPRVKDFANGSCPLSDLASVDRVLPIVEQFENSLIDRTNVPRMPWHDVALSFQGSAARDVARHFVQRWNFIKMTKSSAKEKVPYLMPVGEYVSTREESGLAGTCDVQIVRSSAEWSLGIDTEVGSGPFCLGVGPGRWLTIFLSQQSIQKAYVDLILKAEHFIYIENQFFSKPLPAAFEVSSYLRAPKLPRVSTRASCR